MTTNLQTGTIIHQAIENYIKKEEKKALTSKEWEAKFGILATYNAEVVRGLVHTPKFVKRMKRLQQEYNTWTHMPGRKIIEG